MKRKHRGLQAVKIFKTHKGYYTLSLAPQIAEVIPEGQRFIPELTDEGILYRLAAPTAPLPAWVQ